MKAGKNMNEYKEIINNIMILSETIEEAIAYINIKINEKNRDTLEIVLFDLINALESINNALLPIINNEESDNVIQATMSLHLSLSNLAEALNKNNTSEEIINLIINNFSDWKIKIDKLSKNTYSS
jgi:hypothetical protein